MGNFVKVTLVKRDGRIIPNIEAIMKSTEILIPDGELPIEEDDTLQHILQNGLVDKFIVTDRGFKRFPKPHYQVKYKKISNAVAEHPGITFNLPGPHSRVNINSVDSSINISNTDIRAKFTEIHDTLKIRISDPALQALLLSKLEELQSAVGSPKYATTYQEFIGIAANVMSIIQPFIPFLFSLLGIKL